MEINNIEIRTLPFKKYPARKKDGLHQLKVRAYIGYMLRGKFHKNREVEVKVTDRFGNDVLVSPSDFANMNSKDELRFLLAKAEIEIKRIVKRMIIQEKKINSATVFEELKAQNLYERENNKTQEEMVWNDHVEKFFGDPVPKNVYEEFMDTVNVEMDISDEHLTDDEIEGIASGVGMMHSIRKDDEKRNSMTYDERYQAGNFNKNNIFEVFGFCWSTNNNTGDSHIADSYKSLVLRLNDYRFNMNPTPSVSEFNFEWISDFLNFIARKGYANCRIKGYDPFNIQKFRNKLINAERLDYDIQAFKKIVKQTKRYIEILQSKNLLPHNINTKAIKPGDFISRNNPDENYTRQEHSLTVDEFNALASNNFKDERLNIARDMFVLGVLGGGLRTSELFDKNLFVQNNQLYIYRGKNRKLSKNPILFPQLKEVINRYGGIPPLVRENQYNQALKEIAVNMNFNRIIPLINTKMNVAEKVINKKVCELFSHYFARKTCVTILQNIGFTDEQIINFTEHADSKTLRYYKGAMTIEQKKKLLGEKLKGAGSNFNF